MNKERTRKFARMMAAVLALVMVLGMASVVMAADDGFQLVYDSLRSRTLATLDAVPIETSTFAVHQMPWRDTFTNPHYFYYNRVTVSVGSTVTVTSRTNFRDANNDTFLYAPGVPRRFMRLNEGFTFEEPGEYRLTFYWVAPSEENYPLVEIVFEVVGGIAPTPTPTPPAADGFAVAHRRADANVLIATIDTQPVTLGERGDMYSASFYRNVTVVAGTTITIPNLPIHGREVEQLRMRNPAIVRTMWTGRAANFDGRTFIFEDLGTHQLQFLHRDGPDFGIYFTIDFEVVEGTGQPVTPTVYGVAAANDEFRLAYEPAGNRTLVTIDTQPVEIDAFASIIFDGIDLGIRVSRSVTVVAGTTLTIENAPTVWASPGSGINFAEVWGRGMTHVATLLRTASDPHTFTFNETGRYTLGFINLSLISGSQTPLFYIEFTVVEGAAQPVIPTPPLPPTLPPPAVGHMRA
ncbi:MAG: hypothetical protein FWB91_12830 [Defluviitaleaceae bacterium]|nr:hypothetical protein [Defluviitaleaceae bacterium]